MAERTDITVDFAESPRLIEVADPSAEVVLQDLHDTLRANTGVDYAESDLDNLDEPYMIDSAGKEELGGGVTVGITSTLQNAQVAFESRLTPTETGTVTTANAAGTNLIDSTATFESNGVNRGAVIVNFTDQSITEVLEVVSETELRCRVLRAGTENDFDISDAYKVWNVEQCSISGGNLVALDDVDAELAPVFPTAFTQVVRTASSSATLQELQDIQYASFGGAVHYDATSSYTGTTYPNGTPRQPVNNWADTLAIAAERGFQAIEIASPTNTLDGALTYDNLRIFGRSKNLTELTVPSAASVINCEFDTMEISGTLDGDSKLVRCLIGAAGLSFIAGFLDQCVIEGQITLGGSEPAFLLDCYSGVPGAATPILDLGGSGQDLAIRNYNGGIELRNKTGADAVSIDLASGQLVINDTVNSGTVLLRGVGKWTNKDTYAGAATIIDELLYGGDLQDVHGQVARTIHIDTTLVSNGNGYQQSPYNNWTDAIDDAEANGIRNLVLLADATVDRQLKNFIITGIGEPDLDPNNQILLGCELREVEVDGTIGAGSGSNHYHHCHVKHGAAGLVGDFHGCGFGGDLTLASGATVSFIDCYSQLGGITPRPTIDVNGGAADVSVRSYRGGLTLKGCTNAGAEVTVSMAQGKLTVDASNTAGNISIRGLAYFEDLSAGATVDTQGLLNPDYVDDIYQLLGLDRNNPLTVTKTSQAAGNINQTIGGDGENTSVVTRI